MSEKKIESSKKFKENWNKKSKSRTASATIKLKVRCEFLGIDHKGLNNVQRKAAIRRITKGVTWPVYLHTLDQDPEKDGSAEYRRAERKAKKALESQNREERKHGRQTRAAQAKERSEKLKLQNMDKYRRSMEKRLASTQRALDDHIALMTLQENKRAAYQGASAQS